MELSNKKRYSILHIISNKILKNLGGFKEMAEITASLVKELRERTGAGMMDCKKAL